MFLPLPHKLPLCILLAVGRNDLQYCFVLRSWRSLWLNTFPVSIGYAHFYSTDSLSYCSLWVWHKSSHTLKWCANQNLKRQAIFWNHHIKNKYMATGFRRQNTWKIWQSWQLIQNDVTAIWGNVLRKYIVLAKSSVKKVIPMVCCMCIHLYGARVCVANLCWK